MRTFLLSFLSRFAWARFLGLYRNRKGALGQIGWKDVQFDRLQISGPKRIPWFVYGATDYLEHTTRTEAKILELGGGASTIFWVERGNTVITIETSFDWSEKIKTFLPHQSSSEIFVTKEITPDSLDSLKLGRFDVIINDFDGDRSAVADWMISHLNPGGVVVWDNSDRVSAEEGLKCLRKAGMGWIAFFGIGPINSYASETSVYSTGLSQPSWGVRQKNSIPY